MIKQSNFIVLFASERELRRCASLYSSGCRVSQDGHLVHDNLMASDLMKLLQPLWLLQEMHAYRLQRTYIRDFTSTVLLHSYVILVAFWAPLNRYVPNGGCAPLLTADSCKPMIVS